MYLYIGSLCAWLIFGAFPLNLAIVALLIILLFNNYIIQKPFKKNEKSTSLIKTSKKKKLGFNVGTSKSKSKSSFDLDKYKKKYGL